MEPYTGTEICPKCEGTIFSFHYVPPQNEEPEHIKLICNACSWETKVSPMDGVI